MSTLWFTFGQTHIHRVNGKTFDHDCVVEITAQDPRKVMDETFGNEWANEFGMPPDMFWYPRGIIRL